MDVTIRPTYMFLVTARRGARPERIVVVRAGGTGDRERFDRRSMAK